MLCTIQADYKGLVTVALRKFFKIHVIAKKLVFRPFSINSTFQEPLVYMLRYTFREAADLQGGGKSPPPPPPVNAALLHKHHCLKLCSLK